MDPEQFWKYTPAEFKEKYEGFDRLRRERVNELLYLAWHVAYFMREPKPPALKDIFINEQKPKEQTTEQMLAMGKMLNAALGGDFVEV